MPAQTDGTAPEHTEQDGRRVVGAAALGTAALVVIENVVLAATGAPSYASPLREVVEYYAANRGAVAVAAGLVAVYLPLLLVFLTGLAHLDRGGARSGARWARLAVAAGAVASAVLVLANVLQMGLALTASDPGSAPVLGVVWVTHAAAFGLTLPVLGATVAGAALAAHATRLVPAWLRPLGLTSAALLLIAGVGGLAVAAGSPLVYVGLLGFFLWLVWLTVTGVQLLRARAHAGAPAAPGHGRVASAG